MKKIAVIMGSASDLPVVRKAADTLKAFGVPHEVHVYSAHRTPDQAAAFARSARENGFAAIIAAAGMAAHLAGALAAQTTLPVIGIPLKSNALDGVDALLSTVQMPSGIPVAAVAIDGPSTPLCLPCRFSPWRTPPWRRSWRPTGPPGRRRRSKPAPRQRRSFTAERRRRGRRGI